MPCEPVPETDVEIPASLPVTATLDVVMKISPPRCIKTEIPAPADPETAPVGSMVTDPVPCVVTSIPLVPATLATLTVTELTARIFTAGPDSLSTRPVAVKSTSPAAELLASIATPLFVDTRPTAIEMP